jgi:hypothetical protein
MYQILRQNLQKSRYLRRFFAESNKIALVRPPWYVEAAALLLTRTPEFFDLLATEEEIRQLFKRCYISFSFISISIYENPCNPLRRD